MAQRGWLWGTHDDDEGGHWRYAVYVPERLPRRGRVPVLVALHGCTQTAEDFAEGTGLNALADRHGFVVVYPEQSEAKNRNRCWNWFLAGNQVRGAGEPAAIAGIVERVLRSEGRPRLDRDRVFVIGMSAGAAMAVVMAVTYPDLFAGAGVHSGVMYAAARTAPSALLAMRSGGSDGLANGRQAWLAMGDYAHLMPVVVIHGAQDQTVRPVNGNQVVSQWLATNRLALSGALALDEGRPDRVDEGRSPGGLAFRTRTWNGTHGSPLVQHWSVSGLGHAWSGGSSAGSYTDPAGPSASSAMWAFLGQQTRASRLRTPLTARHLMRRALGRTRPTRAAT
jgi:poly(hydroxyalkanoate) depolymerase family esterase